MENFILQATTVHTRHVKLKRSFTYKHFMFGINLLELENLTNYSPLIGINKFGLYQFCFKDHYILATEGMDGLERLLKEEFDSSFNNYQKITLLTNLRSMGYIFNPISVYICLKFNGQCDYIYEVGNTFGEQKYFFTQEEQFTTKKDFYVSPFIEHNHLFQFSISTDQNKISLSAMTREYNQRPILTASMKGHCEELTIKSIVYSFIKHPFINFKVIFLIHLQALILFIKKVPFYKKDEYQEHQTNQHQLR